MSEPYHVDLQSFSLDKFRRSLENGEVLPSRKILKEDIPARFAALQAMGIRNLKDLVEALSSKKKMEQFASQSALPLEYLEILKRQTRIFTPEPILLQDFPGVERVHVERLAALGIKNSRQLYEQAQTAQERADLAQRADVPPQSLLELVKLCDLARAGWVGPILARLFYAAGVDSIENLLTCSAEELYDRLIAINAERKLTKGAFTVKDVAACIEIAQELPIGITYA